LKINQSRSTTSRQKLITPLLLQEHSLWVTLSEIRLQRQQWRLQIWSNHLSRTQHSTLSYSRWLIFKSLSIDSRKV
jgi:hypothetical protein